MDAPAPAFAVYRYNSARVWVPISRTFPTRELAQRHLSRLPDCWKAEVREVPPPGPEAA